MVFQVDGKQIGTPVTAELRLCDFSLNTTQLEQRAGTR